ncbi:MAG: hypothetical protein ABWY34_10680, partial [Pseudoxanthomonas sp.]
WAALAAWFLVGFFVIGGPLVAQLVWFAAAAVIGIGQFWFIRCTRCRSHIPSVFGVGLGKRFNPINFCPFCGVDLDESAARDKPFKPNPPGEPA